MQLGWCCQSDVVAETAPAATYVLLILSLSLKHQLQISNNICIVANPSYCSRCRHSLAITIATVNCSAMIDGCGCTKNTPDQTRPDQSRTELN